MAYELIQSGLLLFLICSGVPLGLAALVSILLAVLQSATQVQEQTVQFVVRVVATASVIAVGWSWGFEELVELMRQSFLLLADIS